jgi:hypothetical protein
VVARTRAAILTAVVLMCLATSAVPAAAADGSVGVRETVCADTLFVRTTAGGAWTGTLYHGQTFLVEGPTSGGYIYGFAYGYINRHGWVQNGWFC